MLTIGPKRYFRLPGEDFAEGQRPPLIESALCCQGCFAPDAPKERSYASEMANTILAQAQFERGQGRFGQVGRRIDLEREYGPQYTEAALRNLNLSLRGTGQTPGYLDLMREQNLAMRGGDIADVTAMGPAAVQAALAANPQNAALLGELNRQAMQELQAGESLTPEQQRQMQQYSRAAFASRGMSGSYPALADEVIRTYQLGEQMKGQRRAFAGNVLGYNQAIGGDPYQLVLGRPSNAVAQAQGLEYSPLFNPESAYAGNLYNAQQQMDAMFAEPSTMAKIGQVSGAVGNLIGGVASGFV